jgi:hypothetical protein
MSRDALQEQDINLSNELAVIKAIDDENDLTG